MIHRRQGKRVNPRHNRPIETCKNLVIAALLISAALLTRATGLFGGSIAFPGNVTGGGTYSQPNSVFTQAAAPFYAVVTQSGGSHYGAKYDGDAVSYTYEVFASALGEAVGASDMPVAVTEAEWRTALSGLGVFFDFLYEQPLAALARWLGMDHSGGLDGYSARRICLSQSDDGATLYFAGSSGIYRCETTVYASIKSRIESFRPNGARFVFESAERYTALDPYMILLETMPPVMGAISDNPLTETETQEQLLSVFGMNSTIAEHYKKSDNITAYIDGDRDLRIDTEGIVSFTLQTPVSEPSSPPSVEDAIQTAMDLLNRSISVYCGGEAKLSLTSAELNASTGEYMISFIYTLNGLPVTLPGAEPAAKLKIADGIVTEAQLTFREFSSTGVELTLQPEKVMAVIAPFESGREITLVYDDNGSKVTAGWKTVSDQRSDG